MPSKQRPALEPITLEEFRAAERAGGVASVTLKGEGGGFYMALSTRSGRDAVLATTRGKEPRRFTSLDKAVRLLLQIGVVTAQVDARNWNPHQTETTRKRPDRAAAMKRAHEAAAHDRWFRAEVEQALREASDPTTRPIPHDRVLQQASAVIHSSQRAIED